MKKQFISLVTIIFLFFMEIVAGQSLDQTKILKVRYESSPITPQMVSMLNKQTNTPEQYVEALNLLDKYKIYYTLYINLESNESIFKIDSINSVDRVSSIGNIQYSYAKDMTIKCAEKFAKSEYSFDGDISLLDWDITNEKKKINGYKCIKARCNKYDINVWFTTDIGTNRGPGYFQGLTGLVMEGHDFFASYKVISIDNLSNNSEFYSALEKYNQVKLKKKMTFEKALASKNNFINMIKNK